MARGMQVHTHELEAQLSAATAELQELKSKQRALESRNLLLEKMVQFSKQNKTQPEVPAQLCMHVMLSEAAPMGNYICTFYKRCCPGYWLMPFYNLTAVALQSRHSHSATITTH